MKRNKGLLFSVLSVLIVLLVFGCSNDSSSNPKKNIEVFLNKKSELYEEQRSITDSFYDLDKIEVEEKENDDLSTTQTGEIKLDEILKDIKSLLTEKEYERLISNRYLIDKDLIEGNYDKTEIKDIEFKKISEDKERAVYTVKHTEDLYSKGEFKGEKKLTNEFTLGKIHNNWLISHID